MPGVELTKGFISARVISRANSSAKKVLEGEIDSAIDSGVKGELATLTDVVEMVLDPLGDIITLLETGDETPRPFELTGA